MKRAIVTVLLGAVLNLGQTDGVEAKDLSKGLVDATDIRLDVNPVNNVAHQAHFVSAASATFGLLVKQLAPSAADFPAISTVPGFTFRYNPQLQVFERSSTSLGPVFVERPLTLGARKFELGMSFLYVDFKDLEGDSLEGLKFSDLGHNDCCNALSPPPSPGFPAFEEDTADLRFEDFELYSYVLSFFATYGITDRWDINFLIPVVFTTLDIKTRQTLNNESGTNTHFFNVATRQTVRFTNFDDDKAGVGDILLRTKYHLYGRDGFNLAGGLTLRVPSGDEDNFQGLGDTTLTPFFALAQEYGPLDFHVSSGVEFNFDDSDRNRIRYGGGVTLQLLEQVAFLVDVVGSSGLKKDRISQNVTQFVNSGTSSEGRPATVPTSVTVHDTLRTDIVDLNVGFKASLVGPESQYSVVAFSTVFVPLNNDGLRADAIPAVGIELGF
jgi:hypothetical protein